MTDGCNDKEGTVSRNGKKKLRYRGKMFVVCHRGTLSEFITNLRAR